MTRKWYKTFSVRTYALFGSLASFCLFWVISALVLIACRYPIASEASNIQANPLWKIAHFVQAHTNYFLPAHGATLAACCTCTLLLVENSLNRMLWRRLHDANAGTRLDTCDSLSQLANSPTLMNALLAYQSRSRTLYIVIVLSLCKIAANFAVSPIYKSHYGSWTANGNLTSGAYIAPIAFPRFNYTSSIPVGVQYARSLNIVDRAANRTRTPYTTDAKVVPFLFDEDVQGSWAFDLPCVPVMTSRVDCSSSISGSSSVTIDDFYWTKTQNGSWAPIIIDGYDIGHASNTVGLASTFFFDLQQNKTASSASASAIVAFMAADTIIEGATTISSPLPGSGVSSASMLFCRSQVEIQLSTCQLSRSSANQTSALVNCQTLSSIEPNCPTNLTGMISHAESAAGVLAAGPVWSMSQSYDRLPAFRIHDSRQSNLFPDSFSAFIGTAAQPDTTTLPMDYILDTLFPLSQHSLVQGMMKYDINGYQQYQFQGTIAYTAKFATSQAWLIIMLATFVLLLTGFSVSLYRQPTVASFSFTRLLIIGDKKENLEELGMYQVAQSADLEHLAEIEVSIQNNPATEQYFLTRGPVSAPSSEEDKGFNATVLHSFEGSAEISDYPPVLLSSPRSHVISSSWQRHKRSHSTNSSSSVRPLLDQTSP